MPERIPDLTVPRGAAELLYLRALWSLDVVPDVPEVLDPPTPMPVRGDDRIASAWSRMWEDTLAALGGDPDGAPPDWVLEHGTDGLEVRALKDWSARHAQRFTDGIMTGYREGRPLPEATLDAALAAARAGLTTVAVLPLGAPYAWRVSERTLVVSEATRDDPTAYSAALRG